MSHRIMIDGRNLSLEKGTGVATYARNLSFQLRDLGYRVEVLYGSRAAPGRSHLMQEIAFFDSNAGDIPKWLRMLRATKETLSAPFDYRAEPVPVTGTVITDTFKSRLPYFDVTYNHAELYRRAHGVCGLLNQLHKVTLASK